MKKSVITSSMLAVLLSGFLVTPISAYALERSKGTTEETVASETSLTEQQMSSGVTEEMNPSIINSQEETETTSTSSTSDSTTEVSTSEVTTVNDTENSSDDTETTLETSQSNEDTPIAPAKAEEKVPDINYQTHIQDIGWQGVVKNGEISGTSRRSLRLEGIKMNISNSDLAGSVEYRTHVQEIGWQGYVKDNQLSGTSGKSLRLEAIQIRLTGEIANAYDVYYRVHIEDKGWLNWAKNSESAGSQSAAKRLESIQIKLVKKGKAAPEGNGKAFLIGNEAKRPDEIKPTVNYQTHVQNIGWQGVVKNGEIAGTSGKNLQLEAIKINLSDADAALAGNIEYSTHIQNIGWQDYKANGALSGTTGKNLQLEAIKIKLSGDVSRYYDVYYRVHIQDKGWLNWAANGAPAGSQSASKRLEAIQIKIVRKGETAPKGSGKAFLVGDEARTPAEIANRLRAERLKKKPYYYSQRDPQWINTYIGNYTIGAAGCVPTSLSMILRGSYGYNVNPVSVATRMASYGGLNQRYFGASATDLVITAQSYGRSIKVINDVATLNAYLSEGYPVILYQNVGIGHAIVVHEYKNGYTLTYDPYGRQFYSGWVSTQALWNTPSNDPIDWTEGRPCFVIL